MATTEYFHVTSKLQFATQVGAANFFTSTVDMDIFAVNLFSLYSRLVNNREIKLTLIIQRQLQYYSISAAIVKIKYAK